MKYIELVKGLFTDVHEARAKQVDPYVVYSKEADKFMFNLPPEPVTGPTDNEIWYTSSDGNIVNPSDTSAFGANIVSNTYKDGKGVITFDGEVTSIGNYAFSECDRLTSVTIPNRVTTIGDCAFQYCSSLTNINIPNEVVSIGVGALSICSSLTSITIPENVTTIGKGAFASCLSLTSINIPIGITRIEVTMFGTCSSLTSITIPNNVASIGTWAFRDCASLNSIVYEGTTEQWNAITKDSEWNLNVPSTYVQCSDGQVAL